MLQSLTDREEATLQFVSDNTSGSYIAGGYIRDNLLGLEWNDVDVFIHKKYRPEFMVKLAPALTPDQEGYEHCSFESYRVKDSRINIIFVEGYKHLTDYFRNSFDINLCKAWYGLDKGSGLYLSKEFKKDWRNKTLTVICKNITFQQYRKTRDVRMPILRIKTGYDPVWIGPYPYP